MNNQENSTVIVPITRLSGIFEGELTTISDLMQQLAIFEAANQINWLRSWKSLLSMEEQMWINSNPRTYNFHPSRPSDLNEENAAMLTKTAELCEVLGLTLSAESCRRVVVSFKVKNQIFDYRQLPGIIQNIIDDLDRKFKSTYALTLPEAKVEYYKNPYPFGEDVAKEYPEIEIPAIECAQCLALSYPYASIFLSLGIVEVFVRKFAGTKFNIPEADRKEWGGLLGEIEPKMKAWYPKKLSPETDLKNECSTIISQLSHLNKGYRIKIAHLKAEYKDKDAEKVFDMAKDIVQELAVILRKQFPPL